jgi:hypothetical protein
MIRVMGIGRRSLIVAVMAVTALASALDGCLMDCHPQAPAAGTQVEAHCHPPALSAVEGAGTRWQADPTCHHDHTAAAAESAKSIRIDSQPLGVVASPQTLSVRPLLPISPVSRQSTPDRSGPTVALVSLRV